MTGLVWIALRKDDPDLTLAQVKAIPLNNLDFDLAGAEGPDNPTEPPPSAGE